MVTAKYDIKNFLQYENTITFSQTDNQCKKNNEKLKIIGKNMKFKSETNFERKKKEKRTKDKNEIEICKII